MAANAYLSKGSIGVNVELILVRLVLKKQSLIHGLGQIVPNMPGQLSDLLRVFRNQGGQAIDGQNQIRSGSCRHPN